MCFYGERALNDVQEVQKKWLAILGECKFQL